MDRNLILVGFMGTGKSTVGRLLARALGFRFSDTDAEIEADAGHPIPEIFAAEGEAGFRDREQAVLRRVLASSGQVVSTGGGIVLRPENRDAIRRGGTCVWLSARPETIWSRVSAESHRPLLHTPDPQATIRRMLADREDLYRETAGMECPTDDRAPGDIARIILDRCAAGDQGSRST
jgi:shikimate kinase